MSFDTLFDFEKKLAKYTGAPYAIATDCCTHAIELCMVYNDVKVTQFTSRTYLSVPMTLYRLGIKFEMFDHIWTGEYKFENTNIWDSARRLEPRMYRKGQMQCLSFGYSKPMHLGRCGAILLDNEADYYIISEMRSDGRALEISPWDKQKRFYVGYHYCPTLETCKLGIDKLDRVVPQCQIGNYPDCRQFIFSERKKNLYSGQLSLF